MKKLNPKPHQINAITDIIYGQKGLINADRVMFISACATGKTLTGLWAVEEYLLKHVHNEQKIVVFFFPSLALISQSYQSFEQQTSILNYNPLVVCSETKIGQIAEDPEVTPDDSIVYETCTNIENTKAYLSDLSIKTKVIFVTYHSAPIVGSALLDLGIEADIGSFDEAHRTAQQGDTQKMSYALINENFPIRKRLFMTATPKHISTSNADEKAEFSMDRIESFGEVAHELPMRQAIEEGLICDYSIVAGAMESSEEIDDENAISVIAETFIRGIMKTGVKTAIAFQKNIATSKAFAQWVSVHYPDIQIRHIDGTMRHSERESVMQFLREGENIRIITNSKILSEGVDVPAVDMVAFLSNSASEIDIVQRVGRVQRLLRGFPDKIGYIFVPIITNTQKEIIYGEENLLNIIANLRENDEQLRAQSVAQNGRKNIKLVELDDKFPDGRESSVESVIKWLYLEIEAILLTGKIKRVIASRDWTLRFNEAKEIYVKKGKVPVYTKRSSYQEQSLGQWIAGQRKKYKDGELEENKAKLLIEAFGESFFKDFHDIWSEKLKSFAEFYAKNGRIIGPKDNKKLYNWYIANQRLILGEECDSCDEAIKERRKQITDYFAETRVALAKKEIYDNRWIMKCEKCRDFIKNNGKIPRSESEEPSERGLASWIKKQKKDQKTEGVLDNWKIKRLLEVFGNDFFKSADDVYNDIEKNFFEFCMLLNRVPMQSKNKQVSVVINKKLYNEKSISNWWRGLKRRAKDCEKNAVKLKKVRAKLKQIGIAE